MVGSYYTVKEKQNAVKPQRLNLLFRPGVCCTGTRLPFQKFNICFGIFQAIHQSFDVSLVRNVVVQI